LVPEGLLAWIVPAAFHAVLPEYDDSPHALCRNLQTIFFSRLRSAIFEGCSEFLILLKDLNSLDFFRNAVAAYGLLNDLQVDLRLDKRNRLCKTEQKLNQQKIV
jgi:hypothetical protein